MNHNQRTILIIDDCLEDREAYRRYLLKDDRYSYTIFEEEYGENGLELSKVVNPDAILLDFLLPDIDGLEFLNELKTQQSQSNLPVVMLTGQGNEAIAVAAIKSGASDYLVKGNMTPESLRLAIHKVVERDCLNRQLEQTPERKLGIEQLQESQQFIQRLTDTIPDILYLYDLKERRNIYINRQITEVLGYAPEAIQAMGSEVLQQLMHPDDFARLPAHLERFNSAQEGEIIEFEYRMRHVNGEWRWLHSRESIFARSEDGSPRQLLGTTRDITSRVQPSEEIPRLNREVELDRRQQEFKALVPDGSITSVLAVIRELTGLKQTLAASQENEERLRLALEAAGMGMWDYDLTSGQICCSQQCQAMLGLVPHQSEFNYEDFINCVHPEERSRIEQTLAEAIASKTDYDIEYRVVWPDGTIRWIAAMGRVFDNESGSPVRMVGIALDITERKQAEEERNQLLPREQAARADAEAANRAKDEFLAMVSHDLRNPLNAILNYTQLLQTKKVDEVVVARALETIKRNAKLQAQLIEDLLDISRITSGTLRLSLRPVDLALVIEAAIETMQPAAQDKGIQIESLLSPAVGRVRGDANRLQQVIWNLLSNAIKFTPEGGRIQIQLQRIDNHAQIAVSDTGQGISPEFLPFVFERFRQADSTGKPGGLGLGLAIAHDLVKLHNGTVQVDSRGQGQGATFTIKLPLVGD
jgi:hypothetical protein